MKKFLMALPLIAALLTFTSCEDKVNWPDEADEIISKSDIYGKWSLGGTYNYESIEFILDDYFILVQRSGDSEPEITYGKYYVSGTSVILSGFGTMDMTSWSSSKLSFTMDITDGVSASYSGSKEETISDTDETVLASTIWRTVTSYSDSDDSDTGYVIFTSYGTLLLINEDGTSQLGEWVWAQDYSSGDKEIYYMYDGDSAWSSGSNVNVYFTSLYLDTATIKINYDDSAEYIDVELVAFVGSISSQN